MVVLIASSRFVRRKAKLDAVPGGIAEEQLNLIGLRHSRDSILDAEPREPLLELRAAFAAARRAVEGAAHVRGARLALAGLAEVQHRALARVEPVAETSKRGAIAEREAHDVAIEIAQLVEQRAWGSQVVVIERVHRHGCSPRGCDA